MEDIDPITTAKSNLEYLDKERVKAHYRYRNHEIAKAELFQAYQAWLDSLREYNRLKNSQENLVI